jgi:hypothetical protein
MEGGGARTAWILVLAVLVVVGAAAALALGRGAQEPTACPG